MILSFKDNFYRRSEVYFFLLVVAAGSATICNATGNGSWYIGCYQLLSENLRNSSENVTVLGMAGNPISCGRQCLDLRFKFTAIYSNGCLCSNNLPEETLKLLQASCNLTCALNTSALVVSENDDVPLVQFLPCGGSAGAMSVYLSAGPYLYNLSSFITISTIHVGQAFVFSIVLGFAGRPNMPLGFESPMTVLPSAVYIEATCPVNASPVTAKTKHEQINIICIASAEGNQTANVTVANIFSEVSSSVSFVVLASIISKLDVTSLPDEALLPSCSPEPDPDNATSQRVFEGILTKFEASVDICSNDIAFDWLFVNSFGVVVFNVSQNGSACHDGQSCTVSIQEYRFDSAGTYSVYVNASNSRSSASDQMQLMVVSPGVENMTLAMQTPVGVRGEQVNILVSMIASLLPRMVAVIDFGDGMVRQFGFQCRYQECYEDREDDQVEGSNPDDAVTSETVTSAVTTGVASSVETPVADDTDGDDLEIMETYSYSHDCKLMFEVSHIYTEEGVFQPTVLVGDGFSNASVALDGFLMIANKLKSVVIHSHGSTKAVGHNVSFTAITEAPSKFVSYFWQISREDSTIVLEHQTNHSVLYYVFLEPGQFEVQVNASNPVDSVFVVSNVVIEAPIENLQISCSPFKYVAIYQQINCSATVDGGTNVDFKWSFRNTSNGWTRSRNMGLLSNAVYRFFSLGSYSVSVNASNSIGWISGYLPYTVVVLEPVSNLWSSLPPPALLGGLITFEARAEAGVSYFVLEFDFGDSSEHVVVNASTGVGINVSHEYEKVGSYRAMVCAWNEVSRIRKRFDVDILEDIRNVSLAVVGPAPVNGRRTVLAAYVDGRMSNRSDLVYSWSVNGDVFSVTQSPVTQLTFNDSSAIHNVSIVVYNLVALRSDWLVFNMTNASNDTSIRFDHDVFTAVGLSMTFTLVNMGRGKVEMNYGDNSVEDNETSADDDDDLSFEHTYAEPGVYEVWARCFMMVNDNQTDDDVDDADGGAVGVVDVRTAISVQRKLTSLTLSGPDVLPTNRLSEPSEWSAAVSNATNVVYVWMLDDVVLAVSAKNKIYEVTSIGHHAVSVVARNGLGQLTANKSILLQNPIVSVVMEIDDVALGAVTRIHLDVRGDRDFLVTCSFGDGTGTIPSNATVLSATTRSDPEDESSADEITIYKTTIEHRYSSLGLFPVLVNVSNHVSWMTVNETARVYEPIGDVVLTTNSAIFVSSGSVVMVTAVAMVNYDLMFTWKTQRSVCLSSSTFNGSFWQSKANCSLPSVAGIHLVDVNVSSYLAGNWKTVNVSFTCIDPVHDLVLGSSSTTASTVLKTNMTHVGNYYTDPVRFEASLSQGSNVSCLFDFGDNSSSPAQNVSGERPESSSTTKCRATHVFRKASVYRVNVTAVNPISSLSSSMLFYVQVPPSGLRLAKDPEPYRVRIGQDVVFSANLSAGTDVTYSWWLGSGQVHFQAGQTITHRYTSLGCYSVSVTASNKVGSVSASASVYVQDLIQSVELVANNVPVSTTGIVIRNGATVSFTVTVHPNVRCLADGFDWKPMTDHQDSKDISFTIVPSFIYTYRKLGIFTMTVTARNTLNQQTSEPLIVSVLDELQAITIIIVGETVVNNQIEFDAYHYKGTNVNYVWNFGDNATANATVSKVRHTYTTVGQFVVRVVARNAISQQSANQIVFIVTKFCKPPVVNLLGPPNVVYWRSEDVKIEANVFVNCSITNATTYSWIVSDALTGATYSVRGFALHDPLLFLPKRSLRYGNYTVQLRVSMVNTIVYGEAAVPYGFSVVPSPLQAVLVRGLMRNVSYTQNITFDGSKSWDPDFPEDSNFTYSWSCAQLNNAERTCFADSQVSEDVASYAGRMLTLPGSKFRYNTTKDFVFELTISRPGRSNGSAQQLLTFQEQRVIDVFISCDNCAKSRVNANSRLVLQAVHPGYREQDMVYTWKLSDHKSRHSRSSRGSNFQESCIPPDSVTWNLFANGSAWNSSIMDAMEQRDDDDNDQPNVTSTPLPPSAAEPHGPEDNMTTIVSMTTATSPKDPDSGDVTDLTPSSVSASSVRTPTQSAPGVPPVWIMADEGNSGGRGRRPAPLLPVGRQPVLPSTPAPTAVLPSSSAAQPLLADLGKNVEENAGKGSRSEPLPPWGFKDQLDVKEHSSEGRGASHKGSMPSSQQPQERANNKVNQAVDLTKPNPNAHRYEVFRAERNARTLLSGETTTGVNQSILVINPNVLSQDLQYFVQVEILYQATNETGTSMIAFHMNRSPYRGQCSLNFDAINGGTEMMTEFIVYCRGWKDEDLPISYEANYRLSAKSLPQPIYRGLDNKITFQLPAGIPNNYTVFVEVDVVDALGARTTVCLSSLVIQPSAADEQIIYGLVEDNSTLASHIERGHNQRARLLALLAALRLNLLSELQNDTQLDLRKMIRTELLYHIKDLPLRDMLEVHQSLSVLAEVMKVTDEITIHGARSASFLLERLCQLITQLLDETDADDFPLVDMAVESASNLLSSLLIDNPMPFTVNEIGVRNGLVMKSLDYVETLLTVKARQLFLDQEAMKQSTPALSTFTGHFGFGRRQPIVFLDQMSVKLPSLQLLYARNPDGSQNPCFESNVILYKENPFMYQPRPSVTIKTDIVSATMYSCNGSELNIDNLPRDQPVSIWLANKLHQDSGVVHVLTREFMNIHVFNLTSSDLQKDYLHIDIEFVPFHTLIRAFPVSIFLQVDTEPSPSSYLFRWDMPMPVGSKSHVIDLAALKIEGDRSFFLGFVDQNFNSLRPRPAQAKNMSYLLSLWWGRCLYWDMATSDWSGVGCSLANGSSFREIQCQCNHMTTYGADVLVYPSQLRQVNVDFYFSLPLNPVTCSFIGSLLLIYLILLFFANKLDAHDNRKLMTVSLVDNSPKDRQKYYITLETGFRRGAGTTAKVNVVLHGEYGMSETRELISQTGQPLFERNSRDSFYMTFPESLGSIFKVQLWHDNSGPSPSWYLSRVTVKDACTGDIYYFVCEKWFAVEREDGKVEREVMAADKGLGFSKILTAKSMQYLMDYHLWFSTLVKPSYSRFSRAQRLTCCLCLLMSYMAISTAWYQYVGPPYRGEFSLIDISWQAIIVGMIISVIVLPPTLLIMLIFRRSKVYRSQFDEELDDECDGKEYDRQVSSSEEEEQPSGLSVFEQTMLSWQSLQEWAQKAWAKHYHQSPIGSTQNVKPVTIQNASDQRQPSMDSDREDHPENKDQAKDPPQTKDQPQTETSDVHTQRITEVAPGRLESGFETDRQTSVESTSSGSCGAEHAMRENQVEGWDVDVEETVDGRRGQTECRDGAEAGGEGAAAGKQGKVEEKQEQHVHLTKCHMRSKRSNSSNNTSPSSSFFESSPKETRRPFAQAVDNPPDGCLASSVAPAPLQPPSYGIIHRSDASASSRCASSHGTPSNRSSVKSTCSATSNCSKRRTSKKWRCFVPHYGVYIGWSLCALMVVGCAAVTIYYGYRFSTAQSILWLQSVFFSFLQCIFITHPIIVLAVMVYSGIRYRNDMSIFEHYSDGLITDKAVAKDSFKDLNHEKQKLGHSPVETKTLAEGIAARQRSRYLRFARPPQEQRLIQARHQTMKETNASALFKETVLFIGQFLLLVFIAFGKETETSYQLKASLTKSFVGDGDKPFEQVKSVTEWWTWVSDEFLEIIYDDEGYVDNCNLIGPVSLRQLRIKDEECYIGPPLTVNPRCRSVYNQAPHETDILVKMGTHYNYTDAEESCSCTVDGKFSSYGGEGYAVILNSNDRSDALWQLNYLNESHWIDAHTSAVIIELTLFHPQSNLFATASLLLEIPPLGLTFASSRIAVVYLYKYITPMDNLVLACELLFFLATLLKIHREIIQVLRHGINYLKNVWNVLEVSQCLLSLALIICYTYRFLLIDSLVEKFRSTYLEEFVDVSNLAHWDQVLRSVTGFVLLLVNLQLVKGLRHHHPFARFTNVYNHTSLDFVVFGCTFVIWLGAYVSLGIALFGGVMWEMTSVSQAVGYMTGLLECSYKFPQFKGFSPSEMTIWELYTTSFLVLAYGTNTGYLLAFLTFHYKVFKDEPVLVFGPKESLTYYWQQAVDLFVRKSDDACDNQKQQEVVLPPEFTMAEIQYQVDEMLFKMNALAGTSNLPEKPAIYFTDSDTTCVGIAEDLSSSTGSSAEGNFEGWLHHMKDNLFVNEPHFAQLINCDSQSVVKQEANKQLILQLEMEILRHLQSKRASNNQLSESGVSANNGPGAGGGLGAGALPSPSGCQSTSSTDSSTSAALCAHMSSAAARPWADEIKSLKEVPCLGAMFATNDDGKNDGPAQVYGSRSQYLMTSQPDSNPTASIAANELGAVQQSSKDNASRVADSALELQVLNHLRHLADDDDEDDDFDYPLGILSDDVMETEFGSNTIRRLFVPGRNREGSDKGKWKRERVPSWTSLGSIESTASHADCLEVATEVATAAHVPSAPATHLSPCEKAGDGLVEEDVFGFENEGYVIESNSEEDSDCGDIHI